MAIERRSLQLVMVYILTSAALALVPSFTMCCFTTLKSCDQFFSLPSADFANLGANCHFLNVLDETQGMVISQQGHNSLCKDAVSASSIVSIRRTKARCRSRGNEIIRPFLCPFIVTLLSNVLVNILYYSSYSMMLCHSMLH